MGDCRDDKFTVQTPESWGGTVAAIVADVEDLGRDIESGLGFRPYSVHIVTVRWAAGRRGDGPDEVMQDVEILPPPTVDGLDTIQRVTETALTIEEGTITVRGISGHYREDQLAGVACDGTSSPTTRTFWEIGFLTSGVEVAGQRRRFVVVGVPAYKADRGEWTVTLRRAQLDRARDGSLR